MCSDVSVVICAWNAARTLPAALSSLVAQSARGFEVVVVDDGSTDDTTAVAEAFSRQLPRLNVVRLPRNVGASAAWNAGVAAARGEYITRLDADDTLMPDAISALRRAMTDDMVVARALRRSSSGEEVLTPVRFATLDDIPINVDNYSLWAKMYRRTLLLRHPCYDGLNCWDDLSVVLRIYDEGVRPTFIDDIVYIYNVGAPGATLSNISRMRVLDDHIAIAARLQLRPEHALYQCYLRFIAKIKCLRGRPLLLRRWKRTFPEANRPIMHYRHIPLHLRLALWTIDRLLPG